MFTSAGMKMYEIAYKLVFYLSIIIYCDNFQGKVATCHNNCKGVDPSAIIGAGVAAVVATGIAGQAALPVAGAIGVGGLGAAGALGMREAMGMLEQTRCAPTQCLVSCSQRVYSSLTSSCSERWSVLPCGMQKRKMFLSTLCSVECRYICV